MRTLKEVNNLLEAIGLGFEPRSLKTKGRPQELCVHLEIHVAGREGKVKEAKFLSFFLSFFFFPAVPLVGS